MSRIGRLPVAVPSAVTVSVSGGKVEVKGPKGSLSETIPALVDIAVADGVVTLTRSNDSKPAKSRHGLMRALVQNMVTGVSEGYEKELTTVGVGYRAALQGKNLELQVGFSHPVSIECPDGVEFEVPEQTRIIVRGIDKELVGQVAADIRAVRPPEPYKGKGIRYAGEYVRRKAGKAGAVT